MDWFGLLLGWIPLWAWVTLVLAILIPLLYFFGPILLPIWNMLPGWLRATILGVGAALLAWAGGRTVGARREREEQRRREAGAIQTRAEVDQSVHNMSNKEVRDRLARYNRPADE